MTKPERSVEEIEEELTAMLHNPPKDADGRKWIRELLQAERQRCDEVVNTLVLRVLSNIRLSYLDKGAKTAIEFALEEAITQPNNK